MKVQLVETEEQMQDALSVRDQVFVKEQKFAPEVEYDMYDSIADHIVIYVQGKAVATGRIRNLENTAKLERIAVLRDYRGKGIGRMVIDALEEVAQTKGFIKVKLESQAHAQSFYEKLGYHAVSDVFEEHGVPHLVMIKEFN